jgi:hypothetical protein
MEHRPVPLVVAQDRFDGAFTRLNDHGIQVNTGRLGGKRRLEREVPSSSLKAFQLTEPYLTELYFTEVQLTILDR